MTQLACYATLAQLRARQDIIDATKTSQDVNYLRKLRAATQEIDDRTNRSYQPVMATRAFDFGTAEYLSLRNQDALTITSITDGAGRNINSQAWILKGPADTGYGPYYAVELDQTIDFFMWVTTAVRCMHVTGVWGRHDDYANAWADSNLDISGGSINTTTTSITLSGNPITGADAFGYVPAISAGNLVQIDTEWMQVIATTSTTMTVVRGQNGTTAASHNNAASISVYQPPTAINDICLRWAAWLVAQDNTDFGKVALDVFGRPIVRAGVPQDILEALDQYAKVRVS